jgi:hypothetical protein
MVPRNIGEKLGYQIADPGKWCGFPRPAFLSSEDEHFDSFAAMYYEELEKLYGKAKYYSMDPFHEGGNTEGVDLEGRNFYNESHEESQSGSSLGHSGMAGKSASGYG